MSKGGLPVKKPKGRSVITVEALSAEEQTQLLSSSALEEEFDLDRIEKELLEADKEEGFLQRISRSLAEERVVSRLERKKEELSLRRSIRLELGEIEKQNIQVRKDLLDLRATLLEKEVMSHKEVQKLILEIKVKELNIQKLKKDIEVLDLERTKKEREKELEAYKTKGSTEAYSLKDFQTLSEPHDDEDGENEV